MSAAQTNCQGSSVSTPSSAAAAAAASAAPETGRSLVVDEAVFEEQFLRCPVCHERYNQNELAPKSLPCNHTFCLPCLVQIYDHSQPPHRMNLHRMDDAMDGTLKCPTCRVEIFLNRKKIKELPNDHRVVQMMDFLAQAVSKSQQVCLKHDRQPVNFFCKKCLIPVCRDCTVLDHKETEGHNIADISEAMRENSTEFTSVENSSKEVLEKMKKRSDALANASKRLDILEKKLKEDIKDTFIEYRLQLEKRQEALTNMAAEMIKEQKNKITSRFASVCENGAQLQKLYDDFKACRENNDIRKVFPVAQQIKDGSSVFAEVANLDDHELFFSCEFDPQNENCFLSGLSSLGEIRSKVDPSLKETISAQQLLHFELEEQRERDRLRQMIEHDHQAEILYRSILLGNDEGREASRSGATTDSDEDEESSLNSNSWPSPSMMSHLVGGLQRIDSLSFRDSQEEMDEGDGVQLMNIRPSNQGRSRRGTHVPSPSPETVSRLMRMQFPRNRNRIATERYTSVNAYRPQSVNRESNS